jgi:S-adenosylmethionine decarboxylase
MLDESHCSAHTYADSGHIALDIFTCGKTDPWTVLQYLREEIDLGEYSVMDMPRFEIDPDAESRLPAPTFAAGSSHTAESTPAP